MRELRQASYAACYEQIEANPVKIIRPAIAFNIRLCLRDLVLRDCSNEM
jgi:hypothetical protein